MQEKMRNVEAKRYHSSEGILCGIQTQEKSAEKN
jgi:hypothetical protein